jgi:hypothetical protein
MVLIAVAALTAAFDGSAFAQKSTEIFIPIGKSPGLSGERTLIGRIESIDPKTMTITVRGAQFRAWCSLDQKSQIYIDRSEMKLPNRYGFAADCGAGTMCEIKFDRNNLGNRQSPGTIEWIKLRDDCDGHSRAQPAPVGFVPILALLPHGILLAG